MWGFSPALDLVEEYSKVRGLPTSRPLNILLIGCVDCRHVLKTVSRRAGVPVNFYMVDLAMELTARQILLLTVALEPPDRLGLGEKARTWMEIYGNTLVRPSTARYLMHKAGQLVRMVTDRVFLESRMPCLDLDHLRYKEKDQLENIFKYWKTSRVSIAKIWDQNLRRYLGARYDAKMGVFDWDYNMKLLDVEDGKRVCLGEYKHWRNTGIAFTWLESEVSVANPSLAVGIGLYGDQLFSRGYLGDMETGPYFGFGTDCEEEGMLETRNGVSLKRATDITERHLQRIFHQIEVGGPPPDCSSEERELGMVPCPVAAPPEAALDYSPDTAPEQYQALPLHGQRVLFLPANFLQTHLRKPKYRELFDMVYVAQNYFKFLEKDILSVLNRDCPFVVETRKFVIAYDKKIGDFRNEVEMKMKVLNGEEVSTVSYTKNSHALFTVNHSSGKTESQENSEEDDRVPHPTALGGIQHLDDANPLENKLTNDENSVKLDNCESENNS